MKSGNAGLDGAHSSVLVGFTLCVYHGGTILLEALFLEVTQFVAVSTSHIIVWDPVVSIGAGWGSSIGRAKQWGLPATSMNTIDGFDLVMSVLAGGGRDGFPMAATVMGLAALLSSWMISKYNATSSMAWKLV
jgi:hypothetical protein